MNKTLEERLKIWIGRTADTLLQGWDKRTYAQTRDDLVQEGWITALSAVKSHKKDGGSSLQSWVISQVKRDMVRYLRKEQEAGVNHDEIENYMYEDDIDELIDYDAGLRLESETMLHDLLEKLPERERNVIEMHYFDDMSFSQIGALLGVTKQSACDIFYSGVAKLQQMSA